MKMNWLDKLERKFGRFAIPELTKFIIVTYLIGYLLQYMGYTYYVALNPQLVEQGEVWRVISWILMPPRRLNIFTLIMLLFYYSIGQALERTWGDFRYNMYIFSGFLFTLIGSFVIYHIGVNALHYDPMMFGLQISILVSTYYVNLSLFFAFAASYPDMTVMLYFIIPIKIWWLAVLNAVIIVWELIELPWFGRAIVIISLLNFLLYFLSTRNLRRINPQEMRRKAAYRRAVDEAAKKRFHSMDGGLNKGPGGQAQPPVSKHHCAVCGQTELTNPELEFRFCSKCNGNYEYCMNHLYNHTHVQ